MTSLQHELQGALGSAYRIVRELGGAGMSRVYLAEEVALGRQVVVKVLPPDLAAAINLERFRREIQLAARLQHPHIVPLLSAGQAGDVLYYTMPFIEGESLRARLARQGELPVAETVRLMRDVLDALAYAHEQGVLHRDIKPGNVMVSRHHALVTDFGVAKALSEAAGGPHGGTSGPTTPGVAMGTPAYMAPEQAAADPTIDHRADIYAAGIMAYEMLAGHPPFAGRTPQQLLAAQVNRTPEPLAAVRASVPADLAAIVMRCLEKRPADRWQSADELLRALEGVQTPGGGTLSPPGTALPPQIAVRRRWLAAAGLGVLGVAGALLALRTAGLFGSSSLVDQGVLTERERIIISDFRSPPVDSALGGAVTEAFRVDLAQSPAVTVVQPEYVRQTLERMQRDPNARLDAALAREVAIRNGIKAVVTGDVAHAGSGYVISARLISTASGEALVALRETADDSTRILRAIDRLSHALRRRVGESLRTIDDSEGLEQVTTPSLEALRKYSQSNMANAQGDSERAIALLREAIALDTGFAMAYRRLGVLIGNTAGRRSEQVDALTRAYNHRDRLTDRERYLTLATYHMQVTGEREQAITNYRSLLELYPSDVVALNNLSIIYSELGNYGQAEELARRAINVQPANPTFWLNLLNPLVLQGRLDSAVAAAQAMREAVRSPAYTAQVELGLAVHRREYDSAEAVLRRLQESQRESLDWQTAAAGQLAQLAALRGQLAESKGHLQRAAEGSLARGQPEQALFFELLRAAVDLWFRGQAAAGLREAEAALARRPPGQFDPRDRPYLALAMFYAEAGRPERARALMAEYDRVVPAGDRRIHEQARHGVLGAIALAERRPQDAIAQFRQQTEAPALEAAPNLGRAYDLAGMPDSAIASYERYLSTPVSNRLAPDAIWRARTLYRLGELYEDRGDRAKAADYYAEFVTLWKRADPELQGKVSEAKRRLETLSAERPTT
ncbi:MAG TPA: protein kinase [Gemmatimonadales bacterium]|nr:protein kinase [Gemmatimonadales bacterium]